MLIKDPETQQISGPFPLITRGRGYACVSAPSGLRWLPGKCIKPYLRPANTATDNINKVSPKSNTTGSQHQKRNTWTRRRRQIPSQQQPNRPVTRSQTKQKVPNWHKEYEKPRARHFLATLTTSFPNNPYQSKCVGHPGKVPPTTRPVPVHGLCQQPTLNLPGRDPFHTW